MDKCLPYKCRLAAVPIKDLDEKVDVDYVPCGCDPGGSYFGYRCRECRTILHVFLD